MSRILIFNSTNRLPSARIQRRGLVPNQQAFHHWLNGQKHLQLKVEDNVNALIYAWEQMASYKRLLRWCWVSRGLVTEDEMKTLHPDVEDLHLSDPKATAFTELVEGVPSLVPILETVLSMLCLPNSFPTFKQT